MKTNLTALMVTLLLFSTAEAQVSPESDSRIRACQQIRDAKTHISESTKLINENLTISLNSGLGKVCLDSINNTPKVLFFKKKEKNKLVRKNCEKYIGELINVNQQLLHEITFADKMINIEDKYIVRDEYGYPLPEFRLNALVGMLMSTFSLGISLGNVVFVTNLSQWQSFLSESKSGNGDWNKLLEVLNNSLSVIQHKTDKATKIVDESIQATGEDQAKSCSDI